MLENENTDYNESIIKRDDFNSPINAMSIANRNVLTPGTIIKMNEDKNSSATQEKIIIQDYNPVSGDITKSSILESNQANQ